MSFILIYKKIDKNIKYNGQHYKKSLSNYSEKATKY